MNENPVPGVHAWIHSLRIVRPTPRWVGGVVAGLSDRIGMDRTLGRALFVVLALLTTDLAVLSYGLAWMLLPEPDGRVHVREAGRGRWTSGMTGALVLAVLGAVGLVTPPYGPDGGWWGWGSVLGLAVIGLFAWLVVSRSGTRALPPGTATAGRHPQDGPAPAPGQPVFLAPSDTDWYTAPGPPAGPPVPPTVPVPEGRDPVIHPQSPYPPAAPATHPAAHPTPHPVVDRTPPSLSGSTQLLVVGLAVLAAAAVAILKYVGVFTAGWGIIWAASLATALGVMAIGIIIGAILGRGGGGLTVTTAILVLPVMIATGGAFLRVGDWDGDWDGTLRGDSRTGYDLSFGNGTIDLTDEPGTTSAQSDPVRMDLSFSTAELTVPSDMDVFLSVDNAFSTVDYETLLADGGGGALSTGQDSTGGGRIQIVDAPTDRRLEIDADLSFSTLTVRVDDQSPTSDTTQE